MIDHLIGTSLRLVPRSPPGYGACTSSDKPQDCEHGAEILHPVDNCGTFERGVGGVGLEQIPLDGIHEYSFPFDA